MMRGALRRSSPASLRKGAGDDNDDAPVACSRFRARMIPWRPAPLLIPADWEHGSRGATPASAGHGDELQAADRELAELVALRAQVLRELPHVHADLVRLPDLAAIAPESTREYADTPHRDTRWEFHSGHGSPTPVRVGAGRSDERPWAARVSRVSERERLLDAQLQACFGVPPPETPTLSVGGVLSARPGSARLDLNFDDGFEGDDDVEGGTGGDGSVIGGSGCEAYSGRRLIFFSEDLYDEAEQEDRGEGGESENAVAATTHWTPPHHRRLRPCKLQLRLEEGWLVGRARTFEEHEEQEEEEEEEEDPLLGGEDMRWLDQEQHRLETAEAAAAAEEAEAETGQDAEEEEEEEMQQQHGKQQACAWTFPFASAPTSDARGRYVTFHFFFASGFWRGHSRHHFRDTLLIAGTARGFQTREWPKHCVFYDHNPLKGSLEMLARTDLVGVYRWREALDDGDADDYQNLLPRAGAGAGAGAAAGERESAAAPAPSRCSVTASSPHTLSPPLVCFPLHARLVAVLKHVLRVQWIPGVLFAAMMVLLQVGLVT